MGSRKIDGFIEKANRRLKLQYLSKKLQIAIGVGLATAVLVTLFSRLSVVPYYEFYAYSAAGLIGAFVMILAIGRIPKRQQAIQELDQFTPHNQLLTLSQTADTSPLADDLAKRTEKDIHLSYQLFKNEKKDWFSAKWVLFSLGLSILLLLSALFPASNQLTAKDEEQDQALIEEMIEKVEEQKEQAASPLVRKELESLEETLGESDTAEQALREMVKKQKELELKQQQKEQEGTQAADEEAEAMAEASAQLAQQAGETQTALSEMGKPVAFDLQQSIAANELSGDDVQENNEADNGNDQSAKDGDSPKGSDNSGDAGGSQDEGSAGSGDEQGSGDSSEGESSEGQAGDGESASSPGESEGEGSGQGEGIGVSDGQGDRELLSIPSRIGGAGETTIDGGELAEGDTESFEEGAVDAERGSVRPYKEMVGSYSESYFTSVDRMRLPPDLQKIVEQYFSAIEND